MLCSNAARKRRSACCTAWIVLAATHALLVGLTLGLWLRSYWWVDSGEIGVGAGGAAVERARVESIRGRMMAYVLGYMMVHSDWPFPGGVSWQPPTISESWPGAWGLRLTHAWAASAERPTRFDLDGVWWWWDVKRLPGDGSVGYFGVVIPHGGVAAVLASLWAPAWVRRFRCWRRRRAGQCEKCAYDLRASAGRCPECGAATPEIRGNC